MRPGTTPSGPPQNVQLLVQGPGCSRRCQCQPTEVSFSACSKHSPLASFSVPWRINVVMSHKESSANVERLLPRHFRQPVPSKLPFPGEQCPTQTPQQIPNEGRLDRFGGIPEGQHFLMGRRSLPVLRGLCEQPPPQGPELSLGKRKYLVFLSYSCLTICVGACSYVWVNMCVPVGMHMCACAYGSQR